MSWFFVFLIIVFSVRNIVFARQAFGDDATGKWMATSEILAGLAIFVLVIDIILGIAKVREEFTMGVFYFIMSLEAASRIMRSEKGYLVIRNLYRKRIRSR